MALAAAFAAIAGLAGFDLAGDLRSGTTAVHAFVESCIVLVGAGGLIMLLRSFARLRRSEREAREAFVGLSIELERSRADAERWREEAREVLAGLGEMIARQFVRWSLTAAEKDVALLMVKGLSHKEIASMRGVSEATVRQQATAVYRKAGVAGRHDLVAFFLEDMLAPIEPMPPKDAGR